MADIVVHQLPGAWDLPSISPFCLKLDAWLRIAGLPFDLVVDATPFGGPKGKLPYIEHAGRKIGDSSLIVEYLERTLGIDPDASLSASERAVARAMRRLVEENLYWVMVYERWMVDENWADFRDVVLQGVPRPLRAVIGPVARRGVRRQLVGHGIGLHAREEIVAIGIGDLGAVADFLGDKPFLMGEAPTGIDATAYGFLANIAAPPYDGALKRAATSRPNVMAYLDRMRGRFS